MRFRALMTFILFPIAIYLVSYFGVPVTWLSVLVFVCGFLAAGLAEYTLHRVAFHNRKLPRKIKRLISNGHVFHHRYPQLAENLILPLTIVFPISLILLSSFALLFGTGYVFWFYLAVILSYFLYEFLHYTSHHFPLNLPYFKQMQAYHLSHHKSKPNSRFMITNPLWDWVFGTYN